MKPFDGAQVVYGGTFSPRGDLSQMVSQAAAKGKFVVIGVPNGPGSLPIVQSALFSAPVYIVAAVRAILGLRPDSRPTDKAQQRWFSPLLVPQICVFAALGGTIVFAALRDDRTSVVAIFWASVMAFLLAGPLSAVNARPALERALCGAIRGGIVLVAAGVVAYLLFARSQG